MKTIKCPECGELINKKNKICPKCGIGLGNSVFHKFVLGIAIIVIFVLGMLLFYRFNDYYSYTEAEKYVLQGDYESARKIYLELVDYKDSAEKIVECDYLMAKKLIEEGDYENGKIAILELNGYKDSNEILKKYEYDYVEGLYNEEKYIELIEFCEVNELSNELYNAACRNLSEYYRDNDNFKSAIVFLNKIKYEKDVTNLINEYKKAEVFINKNKSAYDFVVKMLLDTKSDMRVKKAEDGTLIILYSDQNVTDLLIKDNYDLSKVRGMKEYSQLKDLMPQVADAINTILSREGYPYAKIKACYVDYYDNDYIYLTAENGEIVYDFTVN